MMAIMKAGPMNDKEIDAKSDTAEFVTIGVGFNGEIISLSGNKAFCTYQNSFSSDDLGRAIFYHVPEKDRNE